MTTSGRTTPADRRAPALRLLRTAPDFRRLYAAQILSLGGDWFAMIPLLALLTRLTGSPVLGALVLAADTLFIAVLSPHAGVLVDRVDRRRLLIAGDLASAAFVALLFLVRTEQTAWVAVVAMGGVAAVKSFYGPAVSAAVPNLVPREALLTASALTGAAWGVTLAVGASVGALTFALVGADWCFALNIGSFLLSAALVHRVRGSCGGGHGGPRRRVRTEIAETFRFARRNRPVVALLACKPGAALGNGVLALFPLLGATVFHVGEAGVGLLYAARGVGALIGPVLGRALLARHPGRLRWLVSAAMCTFGIAYLTFAGVSAFPVAVLMVTVAHCGGSMASSLSSYGLQLVTPDHIRGRVFSVDSMGLTLTLGASHLVVAVVAGQAGAPVTAVGMGAVVLAYGIGWLAWSANLVLQPAADPDR